MDVGGAYGDTNFSEGDLERHYCTQVEGVMPGPPCDDDLVDVTGEGDFAPARCLCGNHMPCRHCE